MAATLDTQRGQRPGSPLPPQPPAPRWSGRSGYSSFVTFLKTTLPFLAICLVGLLVFWQDLVPNPRLLGPDISNLSPEMAKNLAMVRPRYEGIDENGRPYSVTAEQATQADGSQDVILLQSLAADMTMEDGAWLALTARNGRYNRKSEWLYLDGEVNLFHDQGFEMRAPNADIDLRRGVASGKAGVEGQGPQGQLEAEGFQFLDQGKVIIFTGKSHLLVFPDRSEDGGFAGSGG